MKTTKVLDYISMYFKKISRILRTYLSRNCFKASDSDSRPPVDNNNTSSTSKKKVSRYKYFTRPRRGKDMLLFMIIPITLLAFSGCMKKQDVKVVHNYLHKTPSFAERRQQLHLDLYVYKKLKDSSGKESVAIYKAE